MKMFKKNAKRINKNKFYKLLMSDIINVYIF